MNSDLKKEYDDIQVLIKTNCAVALIEKEPNFKKYSEVLECSPKVDEDSIFEQY